MKIKYIHYIPIDIQNHVHVLYSTSTQELRKVLHCAYTHIYTGSEREREQEPVFCS